MLDYLSSFKSRLHHAWDFASKHLQIAQEKMKENFDLKTKKRTFEVGQSVLVLLPLPNQQLKASFSGPYQILKKLSETDYVVSTPDRRKKQQICHINMIKPYFSFSEKVIVSNVSEETEEFCDPKEEGTDVDAKWPVSNSEA